MNTGTANEYRVMEIPAIRPAIFTDDEEVLAAEPITYTTHEYERCACGCGRMIWRRDWT